MKNVENREMSPEIQVGKWRISAEYGILSSPKGINLLLQPRLSKLMYLLSLNANEIVSRDYLVKNIWENIIVNDDSLTRAIADLRKLLLKNFGEALVIDTIPKRGYKLSLLAGPRMYALKFKIDEKVSAVIIVGLVVLLVLWYFGLMRPA